MLANAANARGVGEYERRLESCPEVLQERIRGGGAFSVARQPAKRDAHAQEAAKRAAEDASYEAAQWAAPRRG